MSDRNSVTTSKHAHQTRGAFCHSVIFCVGFLTSNSVIFDQNMRQSLQLYAGMFDLPEVMPSY